MKDVYEVLYQKEADLSRVRKEIESLTLSVELLADDNVSFPDPDPVPDEQNKKPAQNTTSLEPTGTDLKLPRSGFWGSLRIGR
jgi:hypothetical protein